MDENTLLTDLFLNIAQNPKLIIIHPIPNPIYLIFISIVYCTIVTLNITIKIEIFYISRN